MGVADGEGDGDGETDGVSTTGGGRCVLAAVGETATLGGGASGVCVTTYAPPATIVAPAVAATTGWVRALITLADQLTDATVAVAVAAAAVLPPRASERVNPTGTGTSAIPTSSRSGGTTDSRVSPQ